MASKKITTIPSYSYVDTSHPNLKRFVDREGNWTHYFLVKEKRFVKAVNHVIRLGYPKGAQFYEWLKRATPEEADRRLKEGGEEGTRTHQAVRDLASGLRITMDTRLYNDITKKDEKLNNDEWDNIQGYVNFCDTYKPEMIAEEFAVYSVLMGEGYAGTSDRLCVLTIPEDDKNFPIRVRGYRVLALVDWKTSSKLWPEYKLQVSAYMNAIGELGMFADFFNAFAPNVYGVLVRLGSRHACGYEVQAMDTYEMKQRFGVFMSCMNVAHDQEPDFEPEIKQIPWSFHQPLKVAVIVPKTKARKKSVKKVEDETIPLPLPKSKNKKHVNKP